MLFYQHIKVRISLLTHSLLLAAFLLLLNLYSFDVSSDVYDDNYNYLDYESIKSNVCSKELARFQKKFHNGDIVHSTFLKIIRKLVIEKCAPENYLFINFLSRMIIQAERFEKHEISEATFKYIREQEWKKYARKIKHTNAENE